MFSSGKMRRPSTAQSQPSPPMKQGWMGSRSEKGMKTSKRLKGKRRAASPGRDVMDRLNRMGIDVSELDPTPADDVELSPSLALSEMPDNLNVISSIKAMVDARDRYAGNTSAMAEWQARPRTAATLRGADCGSPVSTAVSHSEAKHQQSLRDWHVHCTTYRFELQKWKRDVSRSGAGNAVSFPSFAKK
ncbi:hypothetical protein DIPPA_29959 [Diplonema papillatum]|nr:hypothetical protein DIPPA_29959 [Diplonema papillatum]